jgi:hypothetical protein
MTRDAAHYATHRSKFRTTLVRVVIVQAVALALLGLLQAVYNVS